jgi:hypothetical protein
LAMVGVSRLRLVSYGASLAVHYFTEREPVDNGALVPICGQRCPRAEAAAKLWATGPRAEAAEAAGNGARGLRPLRLWTTVSTLNLLRLWTTVSTRRPVDNGRSGG